MAVMGAGTMQLGSLQLDVDLYSRAKDSTLPVPIWPPPILNDLIAVHVSGTLDKPRTQLQPFKSLKQLGADIFGPGAGDKDGGGKGAPTSGSSR
jgi:hypothetical protein